MAQRPALWVALGHQREEPPGDGRPISFLSRFRLSVASLPDHLRFPIAGESDVLRNESRGRSSEREYNSWAIAPRSSLHGERAAGKGGKG
jgi:hypothetical protein